MNKMGRLYLAVRNKLSYSRERGCNNDKFGRKADVVGLLFEHG